MWHIEVAATATALLWRRLSWTPSFFLYFFNVCLFLRERQSTSRGGAERGRHRIWSKLQALSCQHRAQRWAWTHEPWDHDLNWSRCLTNWATQRPWTLSSGTLLHPSASQWHTQPPLGKCWTYIYKVGPNFSLHGVPVSHVPVLPVSHGSDSSKPFFFFFLLSRRWKNML